MTDSENPPVSLEVFYVFTLYKCTFTYFTYLLVAAKDVTCQSPAESVAAYNQCGRKPKYLRKIKTVRQPGVVDEVAHGMSMSQGTVASSWSVSGTSQWQYPTDVIVNTASDLLQLQQFLVGKVCSVCELCVFICHNTICMDGRMIGMRLTE